MPPEPRLATIATIQQAITSLLTTYEPTFLTFGLTFFRSIAVILIVWHGLKMMYTQHTVETPEHMFRCLHGVLRVHHLQPVPDDQDHGNRSKEREAERQECRLVRRQQARDGLLNGGDGR